ncbi:MAG TPA: sigma-70 family RNA polymerase sigma factor [Solirubrobacteraceae bacterium]
MSTYSLAPGHDDHVDVLRRQALRRPLLSAAEEVSLAERIERGDLKAKERMVESNLRLVLAIANGYRGRGVPFADVVQEGMIGLVRAVERFDHRRKLKFSTYAAWWIRRSVQDAIEDARVIRIPARANRQLAAGAPSAARGRRGVGETVRGSGGVTSARAR